MKPKNAKKPINSKYTRRSSIDSTMRQIRSMESQGLYRHMIRVDDHAYSKLKDYFDDFKKRTGEHRQSFAVIDLIDWYRKEGRGLGISQDVIDHLSGFTTRNDRALTLFLSDVDFDFLKSLSRQAGHRRNAAYGLAVIAEEML